jgi:hypothetical protein
VWRELKQDYRVRTKCGNLLKYLIIWIADDVNFSYLIAMAKEFFKAHFFPEQYSRGAWFTNSLNYYLSTMFFNGENVTNLLPHEIAGVLEP